MKSFSNIMQFINDNWFLIFAAIAIVSVISIKIYNFFKRPNSEQILQDHE